MAGPTQMKFPVVVGILNDDGIFLEFRFPVQRQQAIDRNGKNIHFKPAAFFEYPLSQLSSLLPVVVAISIDYQHTNEFAFLRMGLRRAENEENKNCSSNYFFHFWHTLKVSNFFNKNF